MPSVDEPQRLSAEERQIAADLGFVSILVEAYTEKVPRSFGDNEGVWPVRVRVSADPVGVASATDRANGVHEVDRYTHVWIMERARAELVRAGLDRRLPDATRHGWKNVDDPWQIMFLLADAAEELGFELFDDEQRLAAIHAEDRRRRRTVASGGQRRPSAGGGQRRPAAG